MRSVYLHKEKTKEVFAMEAAQHFKENDKSETYTSNGKIEQECWFARRWGLDRNCVVVFKVCEFEEVVNYCEVI